MGGVTRIAVLSDIHSNLEALEAVTAALGDAGTDGAYVCGDLVGYGADPEAVVARLQDLPLLSVVAGNHDLAVVGRFPVGWFNAAAAAAVRWTAERLPTEGREYLLGLEPLERARDGLLVHGSVVAPAEEYLPPGHDAAAARSFDRRGFERCFFGHTHVPTVFERTPEGVVRSRLVVGDERVELDSGRRYMLNAGSVGQPRDGDPRAAFLVYDTEKRVAEWHRVAYAVEVAQERIRAAGLPAILADRLALGY